MPEGIRMTPINEIPGDSNCEQVVHMEEVPVQKSPEVEALERQLQDANIRLMNKDQECQELRRVIEDQEQNFNAIMARLVIKLLG